MIRNFNENYLIKYFRLTRALVAVLKAFDYKRFAFIYGEDSTQRCAFVQSDLGV